MALTRAFKDLVADRAARDPEFRIALLTEAVDLLLAGDVEIGKAILRDYVNATIGFPVLAQATGLSAKSLMRMLGPTGNPNARNLFGVIDALRKAEGLVLAVVATAPAKEPEAA